MSESEELARLLGTWTMRGRNAEEPDRRTVEFRSDGSMTYRIDVDGRDIVMDLAYSIESDMVVTRDPSSAGEVRSRFRFIDASRLELELGGELFEYVRLLG